MTTDERFTTSLDEQFQGRTSQGRRFEPLTGEVADWTTDFDHTEQEWATDPYVIQDDLRQRCPVAHTDRFGGGWLPTRYEDVAAVAYDTDRFTSRSIVMSNFRPDKSLAPVGGTPPISSDPPFHHGARKLLLPAFTKTKIAALEESTRAYCHELLDGLAGQDVVDAAEDYAQHIPMRVIADMLGFPSADQGEFATFVHEALEGVQWPLEKRLAGIQKLFTYLSAQIEDHLREPREDLTSYLIDAEMDGQKLDPFHIAGTMGLLLIAGIDTTWSAIGASIWHLAGNDDDRRRLAADPSLMGTATEEFLRAYAPVTMARLVKQDGTELGGVTMNEDDWVLLSFPAANRDPAQFERADEVLLDREVNRHAAFGLGIHRCVGSHLARMELRVALEVWMERHPEFTLDDPAAVRWSGGQVRGPRRLPVRVTAG